MSQDLEQRLRAAEAAKEGQYDKRTEHLDADGRGVFINRLILEDSPYLLQHAHNPVDWYPWGEEAFAAAKEQDKPVFLSIGYSTCHWCHVMEVESFDNVEVAKLLNAHFISVKMDREQYPHLDEIYMTGVQLMTGQGGWPMSNFLLPDGRPFFGATYFPPPSFMDILSKVHQAWQSQRAELENSAASIDAAIKRLLVNQTPPSDVSAELIEGTAQNLLDRQDLSFGGIAGAPKFPQEPLLLFLLDTALRERDQRYLAMVVNALRAMAMGGIYDQVAGGFHRYSVDERWLVPHFEKMLYNQSQLGELYAEAWYITGDRFFLRVLQQTLNYVLREMQRPEGGFYSATDADSEGEEGTFFVWQRRELVDVLSEAEFELANKVFDISEQGNFEGANILKLKHRLDYLIEDTGVSESDFLAALDALLAKLYAIRELREPPLRDDKLIVAWNGAMIHTLAKAALLLGAIGENGEGKSEGMSNGESPAQWLTAASKAAQTILHSNVDTDARLKRIALNGTCSITGQLEDYANLVQGLLTLFDATGNSDFLTHSAKLTERVLGDFFDPESATLYLSPAKQDGPQLVRSTNASDGATLSPVATMVDNLLRLSERSARLEDGVGRSDYKALARRILTQQSAAVKEQSISHTGMLRALRQDQDALGCGVVYAAQGLLRIEALSRSEPSEPNVVHLRMSLLEGWHLTAQVSGESFAESTAQFPAVTVAESDSVWSIKKLILPEHNAVITVSDMEQLAVYSGGNNESGEQEELECAVHLQALAPQQAFSGFVQLSITVQLCTEGRCLLPETVQLIARVAPAAP